MKNVVIYYTSTLEFELPAVNMAMGNGNPFELPGFDLSDGFSRKKVRIAQGEKNLFELSGIRIIGI